MELHSQQLPATGLAAIRLGARPKGALPERAPTLEAPKLVGTQRMAWPPSPNAGGRPGRRLGGASVAANPAASAPAPSAAPPAYARWRQGSAGCGRKRARAEEL